MSNASTIGNWEGVPINDQMSKEQLLKIIEVLIAGISATRKSHNRLVEWLLRKPRR